MPDIMTLFDSDFLHAWDLPPGKNVTVTIEKVEGADLMTTGGKTSKKPVLRFKGKKKMLALNKTNTKAIIGIMGRDYSKWPGRLITIYGTETSVGKEKGVPCIRVRPTVLGREPDSFPDREPDSRAAEMKVKQDAAFGREPASSVEMTAEREPGSDDT